MSEQPLHTHIFPVSYLKHLPTYLEEVLSFIEQHLPPLYTHSPSLLFYCKTILSELLTNTIKHAEQDATELLITLYPQYLTIIRRDQCPPLHFSCTAQNTSLQWPLAASLLNTRHVIYKDDLNVLHLQLTAEGQAIFEAWQNTGNTFDINTLHEHYGLLMITLSSKIFTYLYDAGTQQNIFTATVEYQ
ncbi:hypothetical protein SAMN05421788_104392 [Filimonas lacunae]|uniref:Histidine kinase-like ATPase domain-containing protein n=1 Tax=Filimonas lacunae TaxID=477680 RepID=A0A173MRW7_9BACT|nr:hypothetical protein [Filimonas lacunae]BAV10237.1 hypothetical protein FLA_6298 [Filimonas lacunae]SIT17954.1 hypothetical protein SAMN05421788_104392 [Filimonas lacunae]